MRLSEARRHASCGAFYILYLPCRSAVILHTFVTQSLTLAQALVCSVVWTFRGLKKLRSRKIHALHNVCPRLSFFSSRSRSPHPYSILPNHSLFPSPSIGYSSFCLLIYNTRLPPRSISLRPVTHSRAKQLNDHIRRSLHENRQADLNPVLQLPTRNISCREFSRI